VRGVDPVVYIVRGERAPIWSHSWSVSAELSARSLLGKRRTAHEPPKCIIHRRSLSSLPSLNVKAILSQIAWSIGD